jgi:hypothetical protein
MKTVLIDIEGNSVLAYVKFYNEDILNKLNIMDIGDFDFIDFSSNNEKKSIFLGRGFCESGDIKIIASINGERLFEGEATSFDCGGDVKDEEIRSLFIEEFGNDLNYDECLISKASDVLDADKHFFFDAHNYTYCSLETVECYSSSDRLEIEVDDDFKLSDLSLVQLDIDTGPFGSITQNLYSSTGLELQYFGVKYKGNFYEFNGGNDQGGSNNITWFECKKHDWIDADAVSDRIEELTSE